MAYCLGRPLRWEKVRVREGWESARPGARLGMSQEAVASMQALRDGPRLSGSRERGAMRVMWMEQGRGGGV